MRESDTTRGLSAVAEGATDLPSLLLPTPRNCHDFINEFKERMVGIPLEEWPVGEILPIRGLESIVPWALYGSNASGSFSIGVRNENGILEETTLVAVRFDPVEKPEGWGFVGFCFLRKEESGSEYLEACRQVLPIALAEDPGISWIQRSDGKRELIFHHVSLNYFYDQEKHKDPKTTTIFYTDDCTHDISRLRPFAEIPGKDNQITDLGGGWKLLTIRPEIVTSEKNADGSLKKVKQVAYSLIAPEETLDQQTLKRAYKRARTIEGFSCPNEWAAINDGCSLTENVIGFRLQGGVSDGAIGRMDIPNPFPGNVGKHVFLFHRACYDGHDGYDGHNGNNGHTGNEKKVYISTLALVEKIGESFIILDEVAVAVRDNFPACQVKIVPSQSSQLLRNVVFLSALEPRLR